MATTPVATAVAARALNRAIAFVLTMPIPALVTGLIAAGRNPLLDPTHGAVTDRLAVIAYRSYKSQARPAVTVRLLVLTTSMLGLAPSWTTSLPASRCRPAHRSHNSVAEHLLASILPARPVAGTLGPPLARNNMTSRCATIVASTVLAVACLFSAPQPVLAQQAAAPRLLMPLPT